MASSVKPLQTSMSEFLGVLANVIKVSDELLRRPRCQDIGVGKGYWRTRKLGVPHTEVRERTTLVGWRPH